MSKLKDELYQTPIPEQQRREQMAYNMYTNKLKAVLNDAYLMQDKQPLLDFARDEIPYLDKKRKAKYPDILHKIDRRAWASIYKVIKVYHEDALKTFDAHLERIKSQPPKPPAQDPTAEAEDVPFQEGEDTKEAPAEALEEAKKHASWSWAYTTGKRIKEALDEPETPDEEE